MLHHRLMAHLKRTRRDEQWSWYMAGKGYTDSETVGEYKVDYDDDDHVNRILILRPTGKPCLAIAIGKGDDKTASMDTVEFHPTCTIDGKMKRKDGSRKMIQVGLDIAKKNGATQVSITDNSNIDCENGQKIDLAGMYFLKYGMTWFEKYFGFKPTERHREAYEKAKELRKKYLDTEKLKDLPCSYFTDEFIDDLFDHIKLKIFYRIEWVKPLM